MNITTGLKLLAENSWGTTRKILYDAITRINSHEDMIVDTLELFNMVKPIRGMTNEQAQRLAQIEGEIRATAEVILEQRAQEA